jgi:chemotaxis protein methyltransferase CheR
MTQDPSTAPRSVVTAEDYAFLQKYLQDVSGLALGPDKLYFIEARLLPVAERQQLPGLGALCEVLRRGGDPVLQKAVVEAVATHETTFFRDIAPFQVLERHLLPRIVESNRSTCRIRIWSAAASSGQEAYSMVMMLHEMGLADWKVEVLATDISEPILATARQGRYRQIDVNRGLPAKFLVKYFENKGRDWQVADSIRRHVLFQQFDLRSSYFGKGPFDLVMCRNVLIYFDSAGRLDILRRIRETLKPAGYFFLGATETILEPDTGFERQNLEGTSYYSVKA